MSQGRKPGPGTVGQMQELHAKLVKTMAVRIDSGKACAVDLQTAGALLRDSGIRAQDDVSIRRLRRLHSRLLAEVLRRIEAGDASPAVLAVAERLLAREGVSAGASPRTDAERTAALRTTLVGLPFLVR